MNMETDLPGLFFKNVKYQINTHLKEVALVASVPRQTVQSTPH